MANHLEQLVAEWLEFSGYFVRRNVKVGKRRLGGFEGELDVVAYHPACRHLIHIEPSIDAHTWEKRKTRFLKKFAAGQKYIREIFPGLPFNGPIEQWAVIWASDTTHTKIGGGTVIPLGSLYRRIAADIQAKARPAGGAIPEQFPLLRTMQYTLHWAAPAKMKHGMAPAIPRDTPAAGHP